MSGRVLTGEQGVHALTDSCGAVAVTRDVIVADGPDTLKFLQSQLSQDLSELAIGDATWSFLLQPTGKLIGFMRVTRTHEATFRLDADPGTGSGMEAALRRFLIRTKCVLTLVESSPVWALRGPDAAEFAPDGAVPAFPAMSGVDVFVDALSSDVPMVDPECLSYVRIASGVPMFPYELNDSTIPNATGLVGLAVSFSKGCYVGQELVERIDSRGAMTPRVLRRIQFDGVELSVAELISVGAELTHDGSVRGTITSVASLPDGADPTTATVVALGYLHRDTEPGSSVNCGPSTGVVRTLGEW